jgi:serine/threonine protein phosphatase PrpC
MSSLSLHLPSFLQNSKSSAQAQEQAQEQAPLLARVQVLFLEGVQRLYQGLTSQLPGEASRSIINRVTLISSGLLLMFPFVNIVAASILRIDANELVLSRRGGEARGALGGDGLGLEGQEPFQLANLNIGAALKRTCEQYKHVSLDGREIDRYFIKPQLPHPSRVLLLQSDADPARLVSSPHSDSSSESSLDKERSREQGNSIQRSRPPAALTEEQINRVDQHDYWVETEARGARRRIDNVGRAARFQQLGEDQIKEQKKQGDFPYFLKTAGTSKNKRLLDKGVLFASEELSMGKHTVGIASSSGRADKGKGAQIVKSFSFMGGEKREEAYFTAILSGHGRKGEESVQTIKEEFTPYLIQQLQAFNTKRVSTLGVWNAPKIACVNLDRKLGGVEGGCSTNFLLHLGENLWIGGLGNARAIRVDATEREVVQLSADQSPILPPSQEGFQYRFSVSSNDPNSWGVQFGGEPLDGREVPTPQMMAHTLGDHEVPNRNPRPKMNKVHILKLEEQNAHYLVQVDAGITKVVTTNQIGMRICQLHRSGATVGEMARNLVASGYQAGSRGNLTAVVTKLSFNL